MTAANVIALLSCTDREARLVDEMALALLNVGETGSDARCILALIYAGFRGKDIGAHLDAARDLARNAVATP
jgi:hypothetical protein